MHGPPEMQPPTSGKVGGAVVSKRVAVLDDYPIKPKNAIAAAVKCVRAAGTLLREASYTLDDHGYRCEMLDDLASDTLALSATWAGRPVPTITEDHPAVVIEAAREWRRQRRRSY